MIHFDANKRITIDELKKSRFFSSNIMNDKLLAEFLLNYNLNYNDIKFIF